MIFGTIGDCLNNIQTDIVIRIIQTVEQILVSKFVYQLFGFNVNGNAKIWDKNGEPEFLFKTYLMRDPAASALKAWSGSDKRLSSAGIVLHSTASDFPLIGRLVRTKWDTFVQASFRYLPQSLNNATDLNLQLDGWIFFAEDFGQNVHGIIGKGVFWITSNAIV